jgi:hypothetical protein
VLSPHKINLLRAEVGDAPLLTSLKEHFAIDFDSMPLKGDFKPETLYRYDELPTRKLKVALNYQLTPAQRDEFVELTFEKHFGSEMAIADAVYLSMKDLRQLAGHFTIAYHGFHHATWSDLGVEDLRKEICVPEEMSAAFETKYLLSIPFGMGGSYNALLLKEANPLAGGAFTMLRSQSHNRDADGFAWWHRFDQADFFKGDALIAQSFN